MPLGTQTSGGALSNSSLATLQFIQAAVFPTQGNLWFVNPITGSDFNQGTMASPFATLQQALNSATANQNDIVFLLANGNSASATTAYQSATLNWNKDLVHLIGVNDGPLFSQRSRVAFASGYAAATELFVLSANGCLIQNVSFFMGVASALPIGCMTVSGQRNRLTRCHIAGMGNANNDISGSYSLQLKGAEENLFEDCTIGVDTIQLGAGTSNSQILFTSGTTKNTRNYFRGCRVMLFTSSATACLFIRAAASTCDRSQIFEDCLFDNCIDSTSTTLTHANAIASTAGGAFILTGAKTGLHGASGWNSTNAGNVYATGGAQATAGTWGLATAVTG